MKIYFAGLTDDRLITSETNILLSFVNDLRSIERLKSRKKLFLDSGAFSAFSKGLVVDLDKYIEYIKKNDIFLETYANLDVIGDEKATAYNLKYMEDRGLKPLPVFHYKSDLNILKELVSKYDYIALGGLVPLAKKKRILRSWLDTCFSIIQDKVKVHAFGLNAFDMWERYPLYSADATSWIKNSIFYRTNNITGEHDRVKIYKRAMQSDVERQKFLIDIYLKRAKEVTKLWERRGVKWN